MLKKNLVEQQLKQECGISLKELELLLKTGGDPAEMKFMECCRVLWKADGVESIEPFIETLFNKLPERSRSILFQRILTIVYLAQDGEHPPAAKPPNRPGTIHSSTGADEC
jgi:hypothetical protein